MALSYLKEMQEALIGLEPREMLGELIEIGKGLSQLPEELCSDDNRVSGCVSEVHIIAHLDRHGNIIYEGRADSLIVRGYLAILITALSGMKPQEIVQHAEKEVMRFTSETNITVSMIQSRANAFSNVFKKMIKLAGAL